MHKAKRILLGTTAIVSAAAIGTAVAQTYPPAFVTNFNGNSDAVQVVPGGAGTVPSVYTYPNRVTTTYGYVKTAQTLTSNALTVTAVNNQSYLLFSSGTGGTGGTITINFPPNPNDGARFCIRSVNGVTSGGTIAFGPAGVTFTTTPTTLTAATTYCYLYSSSNLTWDPI